MIILNDISIESTGFQILEIENYFDLTTAKNKYRNFPEDGGIKVIPDLLINDIPNGMFYTAQICKKHKLDIFTKNGHYTFDTKEEYLDSNVAATWYYRFYPIIDNVIKDELRRESANVIFEDQPYKELSPIWNKLDYHIEFETWFQYKNEISIDKLIPLCSFNWHLNASIEQVDRKWKIINSSHSDKEQVRQV